MGDATLYEGIAARFETLGRDAAAIRGLRQLPGGASRETWYFEAENGRGGREQYILRRDPENEPRPDAMKNEVSALTAASKHGLKVPKVIDHAVDPRILGSPYMIMEYVQGESIPRRILRDEKYDRTRRSLTKDLGILAAEIHSIPVSDVSGIPKADGLSLLWNRYVESETYRPVLEVAFQWLDERRPSPVPPRLVHGDFRLGNILVTENGISSVLDWELVHLGDPMEDLGYLGVRAWRYGGAGAIAGVGGYSELFESYMSVISETIDAKRVRWWQIAGTLNWGVGAIFQANRHFRGSSRSVELAAVGRRVAEQEYDLLNMLEEAT